MWFFGQDGLNKLEILKKSITHQFIDNVNTKLSKNYTQFSPFMSCMDKEEILHEFDIFNLYPETNSPQVIEDFNKLDNFYDAFQSDNTGVLGYFIEHKKSTFQRVNEENLNLFMDDIKKFSFSFQDMLKKISLLDSNIIKIVNLLMNYIVPIDSRQRKIHNNFSSHKLIGASFFSAQLVETKFTEIDFLVSFIHEVGHQALYLYQSSDDLLINADGILVYSGIRQTPRPAIMAFHAIVALVFMIKILSSIVNSNMYSPQEKKYAENERMKYKSSLSQSLFDLQTKCQFSELGSEFIREFRLI